VTEIDVHRLSEIDRAKVIGTSGSGNDVRPVPRRAARAPIHRDGSHFLGTDWKEPPDEEFIPQVERIVDQSRWVLDGNYSRTTPVKWRRVQLVVWLDMSFARTLFRVSTRCVQRSLTQTELWPGTGNRETLRKAFLSRKSIILWAIKTFRRNRQRCSKIMGSQEYDHVWFVRLKSQRGVNAFLESARTALLARGNKE